MVFEYGSLYGEKKYYIKYKDMFGKEHSVEGEASSKSEAERLFHRKFDNCDIIKTQTIDEWIEEKAEEIADGMMKHIKKDLSKLVAKDKKSVIKPKKVNNIDYNSKSFLRGLKKANEQCERDIEMSAPNHEKKYISYNI
jgi:hypothetical protein